MIELGRWEHGALSDTKVLGNVSVSRLENHVWMAYRVLSILLDVGVQGGLVVVIDLFVSLGLMIQLDRVGSTAAESITGVQRFYNV